MMLDVADTYLGTFLIILNIIHCSGSRFPRSVDCNTLTELAVLIISIFMKPSSLTHLYGWKDWRMTCLQHTVTTLWSGSVFLGSSIIRKPHSAWLQVICLFWTCPYRSLSTVSGTTSTLYMSPTYFCRRNKQFLCSRFVFNPDSLKKWHRSPEGKYSVCSFFECDSLVLGAILKSLKVNGISDVRFPYLGISTERAVQEICEIKSPDVSLRHSDSFKRRSWQPIPVNTSKDMPNTFHVGVRNLRVLWNC